MKACITSIAFFLITIVAFSQTKLNDHLTFKGVPIDGTLNEFVQNMKSKGFSHMGTENGIGMLMGDFAGYKECVIGVSTLKDKDLVSKIVVIFPELDTWASLSGNYYNLKGLLAEKYGEPSEVVEKFDSFTQPDDDFHKMHELGMNNCKYFSTYELSNGTIQVSIENNGFATRFVMLSYSDKINSNIIREKALGDL